MCLLPKRMVSAALLAVLGALVWGAEFLPLAIPDSSGIRGAVQDSWLNAPIAALKGKSIEQRTAPDGTPFQIRLEEDSGAYAIVVAPRTYTSVEVVTDGGTSTELAPAYSRAAPGSWILYRDKSGGRAQRIEWYFTQDPHVCLVLRQDSAKTYADMLVYGSYLARSVPIGVAFPRFYTASFQYVYSLTQKSLPWSSVLPAAGQYDALLHAERIIRHRLPYIDYAEDACYNEDGVLCSIETGQKMDIAKRGNVYYAPGVSASRRRLSGARSVLWTGTLAT